LTTLLDMGRRAMMEEFDHARPMWHITLVENLADGGAALVVKLHHALADGLGGVQIAQLIVDLEPVRRDLGPLPPVPPAPGDGPLDALWDVVRYDVAGMSRMARTAVVSTPRLLRDGVRHPRTAASTVAETAASMYRTPEAV
jgi:diacylglycerol O-acyltransferase